MTKNEIIRCTRCVMDNAADPTITFDAQGHCNYCTEALSQLGTVYQPDEAGRKQLEDMIAMLKKEGEGKPYDCLMGISGGLDSAYLAYLGHQWGLRILAVHIDDGYDTAISKENIRRLCEAAHIDLKVITPDQQQYDALTLAYLKAGVPNLAVPQDNILFAFLYDQARKHGIRHFLTGGNFALECILQRGNTHNPMDLVNLRDIHRRFGTGKLDKLKFVSSYRKFLLSKLGQVVTLRPLNLIDYNRDRAFAELKDFCGFEYYGAKHLENMLTAFIQLRWLPEKFGVDKRTSHLSSMIVSGQMTREDALRELEKPLFDPALMDSYVSEIKRRLNLTDEAFGAIMAAPAHQHTDYKCDNLGATVKKLFKGILYRNMKG